MSTRRIHSRDPEHKVEDLEAALASVLEVTDPRAQTILRDLREGRTTVQGSLREVNTIFGSAVLGAVFMFSIDAETSIQGDVEAVGSGSGLTRMGITTRDLEWPASVCRYPDEDAVHPTPERLERWANIEEAVAAFHAEHNNGEGDTDTPAIPFGTSVRVVKGDSTGEVWEVVGFDRNRYPEEALMYQLGEITDTPKKYALRPMDWYVSPEYVEVVNQETTHA